MIYLMCFYLLDQINVICSSLWSSPNVSSCFLSSYIVYYSWCYLPGNFLMIYFYVYSYVHLFSDMFHLSILILLFVHLCLYLFWFLLFIWTKDRSSIVYGSILYYVLFVCSYVYTIKSILSLYFSFTFLNLS